MRHRLNARKFSPSSLILPPSASLVWLVLIAFSLELCAQSRSIPSEQLKSQLSETIVKVRNGETVTARTDAAEYLATLTRGTNPYSVDDTTLAEMVSLLETKEDSVRAWVAASLGNLGQRAKVAVPTLLKLLPEVDCLRGSLTSAPFVRVALKRIGEPPPRPQPCSQSKENVSVSIKELRNAPTEVVLDGRLLSLSAYPWRDFMPSTTPAPKGSPLMVALKIASSDKKPLPSGVRIVRAWVLFGEQMWEVTDFRAGTNGPRPNNEGWVSCAESPVCEVTARGGPRWGPGVEVDVVLRLTDKEGHYHLLRAPKQSIVGTS